MAAVLRYRRSIFDRLLADSTEVAEGLTLTYNLQQLRHSVARDVETLLNSRASFDFEELSGFPQTQRSVLCFGIRDFVGRVLTNSEEQRHIAASLSHAIQAYEPRLQQVRIEFHGQPGPMRSLAFTIRALMMTHPAAEPVAFDAMLQPTLSRFSVVPTHFASALAVA